MTIKHLILQFTLMLANEKHITDHLDFLRKEVKRLPTKLIITSQHLEWLKDYLGVEELKKYHGCEIINSENITETYYV